MRLLLDGFAALLKGFEMARQSSAMEAPIDGLAFWVTHDQLRREERRAEAAEAKAAIFEAALLEIERAKSTTRALDLQRIAWLALQRSRHEQGPLA